MTQQTDKEKRMEEQFRNKAINLKDCVVCLKRIPEKRKKSCRVITCSTPCSYEWNRFQKIHPDTKWKKEKRLRDLVGESAAKNSLNYNSWKDQLLQEYEKAEKEAKRVKNIRGNTDFKKEIRAYLKKGGVIKRLLPEKASKTYSAKVRTSSKKNMHDGFIPMQEDFNGFAYDIAAETQSTTFQI